jgi:hypothetical protein
VIQYKETNVLLAIIVFNCNKKSPNKIYICLLHRSSFWLLELPAQPDHEVRGTFQWFHGRDHFLDLLQPEFALRLGMAGLGPAGAAGESAAGPHAVDFTSDYATLKRAVATLGAAVAGRGTSHAKRVFKFL